MAGIAFFGNLRGSPQWAKDFGGREHILAFPAKIDPAQFSDAMGIPVTAGTAAAGATSLPVTALVASVLANTTLIAQGGTLIPSGTVLYFGGAKVAQLTADAHIGDTALTVAALPTAFTGGAALAPPAAPTLATAGTGGTVLAGTYGVIITYTNANGETLGSAPATITTTGTTSTITVTAPAASGNATGWYAYVTQANGAAYTRQQAGAATAIGTNLVLTAPPTATGAAPPTTNTAVPETATFSRYGTLYVPSGTVVSRTYAQRDANGLFHPAISTEDEVFLTCFDIADARLENNVELYRPTGLVAENYLPQYGTGLALGTSAAPTALLAKLRTVYRCIAGTN